MSNFFNIIKATRLYRIIPVLMAMAVSMAFANRISIEIILLGICCALVYAVIGIHNAIKDHDYQLPKYTKKVMLFVSLFAIAISFSHYIIFLTVAGWIALGFVYNTIARFILFGDTTILAITHFALPSFSASALLGLNLALALEISALFFLIAWFITQAKNLKDVNDDKKRRYVTLTTKFTKGTIIIQIFTFIPYLLMLASYFLFRLSALFSLTLLIVAALIVIAEVKINKNQELQAITLLRFVFLIFMFGLIIEKTSDYGVMASGFLLCLLYLIYFLASNLHMVSKWTPR